MLAAARTGSNRAWAALVERLDPEGRSLAHLVLGGHAVDETLLAAYVRAYRARQKGSDDGVAFLLHHVWIACGHEIRRRQRRLDPAPGRRADREAQADRLGTDPLALAITDLRPEERAVWALVERAGLPPETVADALGVSPTVIIGVANRVGDRLDDALADATAETEVADSLDDPGGDVEVDGWPGEPDDEGRPDDDDDEAEGALDEPAVEPAPDAGADEATGLHDTLGAGPEVRSAEATGDDGTGGRDRGGLDPDPASPTFWPELGRRLRIEREAMPAAPPPNLPEPGGPSPSLTAAKAPPVAMQRRAPARARKKRPDLVEGLVEEADRQRAPRNWPRLVVKGIVGLVVLGALGALITGLYLAASNARSPVRGDSVADVGRRSMGVLAEGNTWSATIERMAVDGDGERVDATFEVVAGADGSFRIADGSISRLTTYDARPAVFRDTLTGYPPRNEEGVAPGPPDPSPVRADLPLDDLAIAARAVSEQTDEEPETAELNGRAVLRLRATLADETAISYLVDAEDLVPVRVTWTRGGTTVRELRFRDVVLDVASPEFTQDLPPGSPPPVDRGFAPVQISEVQGRVDLAPLTPDFLPGGSDAFVFTGAAVNEASGIVSLRYAYGPQQLVITVRPSPVEPGETWDDPFDRGEDDVVPEEITLGSGPFRDVPAQMVAGGTALPSIWGADGEVAFTVAGDLSPDDLQRVARSLR